VAEQLRSDMTSPVPQRFSYDDERWGPNWRALVAAMSPLRLAGVQLTPIQRVAAG
jgi:hypothetical protein